MSKCCCKCHKAPKAIAWEVYKLGDEYTYGNSRYVKTKKEAEAILEHSKQNPGYYGPYDGIAKIVNRCQLIYIPEWMKK